jgi:creatinine amidohydrolase
MSMFDYRNTSFEIKEGKPKLGILPIAAIEQHGDHLPVATDLLIMNAISEGVAERLEVTLFRLPVFPYGTSMSHSAFSGTLWLSADTLYSVIRDVIESLYEHGVTRVVVINNHGAAGGTTIVPRGNFVAKTAVRQINYDYPEQQSIWVQPFAVAQRRLMEIFETAPDDVHAGEIETSLMLHLHPEQVQGSGTDYVAKDGVELLDFVGFDRLCASGVWGSPSHASAEKGAQALEAAIASTVAYVNESFEHLDRAKSRESSRT